MGWIGGVDAGACDSLTVHFSSEDVTRLRKQLSPWFESTDAAVASCTGLSPEERAAWGLYYQSWKELERQDVGFFQIGAAWNATCTMARALDAWREVVARACPLPGPANVDPKLPATPIGELASVAKYVAVALGIGAAVYLVSKVA